MRPRFRFALVPIAALTLSSLFVACGGGDDNKDDKNSRVSDQRVEPGVWVADVCDIAVGTKPDLDAFEADLDKIDFANDDPRAIQDAVAAVLEGAYEVREDIIAEFDEVGRPDIKDGAAVRDAFRDNFAEKQKELTRLIDHVKGLDPDDEEFLDDLLAPFVEDGETLRDRLDVLAKDNREVRDLIAAFEADAECAKIVFSGDESDDGQTDGQGSGRTPVTRGAVDTEGWVAGFCTAFATYADDLVLLGEELDSSDVRNLSEARRAIIAIFEEARDRSLLLEDHIGALGVPDIADGEQVQATLQVAAAELVAIFDIAVVEANDLTTGDAQAFLAAVEELTTRFQSAFDELSASFDELDQYDTDEIDRLSRIVPECAALE